ncbi:MAG: endonuclease domain-containing protein [Clostridia bacterium]|nr:endonuclease domain-containing protein [Clostridia bacterium]
MQNRIFDKNSELYSRANEMRRNMTRHERHLWFDFLAHHKYRWRRQQVINNYIADFYCAKARLVVELDGSQHYDEGDMLYDERRTEKMAGYDILVLRFSNLEIDTRFLDVCETIDYVATTRVK